MPGYNERVTVPVVEEIADITAVARDLAETWQQVTADEQISPLERRVLGQVIERLLQEVPDAVDAAAQADLQLELMVACSRNGGVSERTIARVVAASDLTDRQRLRWAARLALDTKEAA